MRHSTTLKDTVHALRKQGLSLDQIRKQTGVAKSTISLWVKNISLSEQQTRTLKENTQNALQKGRILSQKTKKENRLSIEKQLYTEALNEIGSLSERELLIAGIALFWGEGFKNRHEHRLGFCNSDPSMIKFYLHWLEKALQIKKKDLVIRLTLNEAYHDKEQEIKEFWSHTTNIPINQFTKTFYQHAQWKREYGTTSYFGVLRVHVANSSRYLFKMRGWIAGLKILAG